MDQLQAEKGTIGSFRILLMCVDKSAICLLTLVVSLSTFVEKLIMTSTALRILQMDAVKSVHDSLQNSEDLASTIKSVLESVSITL